MKRLLVVCVAALLFGLVGTAQAADKAQTKTTIENKTAFDIYSLTISPNKANKWEENLLEEKMLANGDLIIIMASKTPKAEAWDIQVTDESGNTVTWMGVPVSKDGKITLLPDGKFMSGGETVPAPPAKK